MTEPLRAALEEAEEKAWASLGRYKFQMFGYWAGIWVHFNRIGKFNEPNPFKELVTAARQHRKEAKEYGRRTPVQRELPLLREGDPDSDGSSVE